MTKRCICQICTCGRHRCPHNPHGLPQTNGPCTFSEYTNKYTEHPIEPRKNFKPEHKPVAGQGPLEDKTTHRVDYVPHPLEKHYVHQGDKYQQPEGEMETMTNYAKEFTPKSMERVQPIRREETRKALGKFQGEPTYTSDYRKWDMGPREKVTADNNYYPPDAPFEGTSNYTTDYVKHPGGMRQSMRPNEANRFSDQPFEDATDYRQSYVQHPLPPKEVREKTVWQPNEARLDDLSNYRKDYTPKGAGKQASCKPDATPYKTTVPFEGETTQRVDFVEWPTERIKLRERDAYQKPEGNMEMNTTSGTDYTKKPIDRQAPMRPQDSRKVPGKFDGTTNYTTEFVRWPTEARQPTQREQYAPNEAPFEGQPTYQRDYVPHANAGRTASMKPVELGHRSGVPLDDDTEYRSEYFKKQAPPCPSGLLLAGQDIGYQFSDQDTVGHKWYNYVGTNAIKA